MPLFFLRTMVLPGFTGLLAGFTEFPRLHFRLRTYLVLPSFTEFYGVIQGVSFLRTMVFSGFYWVFIGFY